MELLYRFVMLSPKIWKQADIQGIIEQELLILERIGVFFIKKTVHLPILGLAEQFDSQ